MSTYAIQYRAVASTKDQMGHMQVRWDVFVIEQSVPLILEVDARDTLESTTHLVASTTGGVVVGAARLLQDSLGDRSDTGSDSALTPAKFHVGRVAVRQEWRGKNIGFGLMNLAEDIACKSVSLGKPIDLILDAQVRAQGFYTRLGYVPSSKPKFYDAGILHQEMVKRTFGSAK